MNKIGERIAYVRKEILKLSQSEFSKLICASQGALSEIENTKRGLSQESIIELYKLSVLHSFSFGWLLTGEGPISSEQSLDETELLKNYRALDNRGKHTLHAVIYQEQDRIKNND